MRHRALLWSNVSLLLLLLGISLGMRQPLLQQFSVLERQIMAKQVARVMQSVLQRAERLDTHAMSEASWTEMHRYLGTDAERADPDFFEDTYGDSVGGWDYELLGLFDRRDQLRHLATLKAGTQKLETAPIALRQRLLEAVELRQFPPDDDLTLAESRSSFVLESAGQVLLLASRPVLKSSGKGPRHGAVVVGTVLNPAFLDDLVRNTTLSAELIPVAERSDASVIPSAKGPKPVIANTGDIQILDEQSLAAELQLLDRTGQPRFSLRLRAPRLEYQQGRAMLNQLTGILFALGLTLGAVISVLLLRLFRHQQRLQASQAALHQTNLELEKLVNLDGLTQLANRRWFEIYLGQEWSRAQRHQTPLTLILGDIDYFKHFNDTYGHLAGDACLLAVSSALKRALKRPTDLVARFGGEEFAVILPETTLEGGKIVAEALLEQIRELKIPHRSAPSGAFVSVSFGVACITPHAHCSPELLIEQSDQNLYLAKHRGRNQVCAQ